MTYFRAIAKFPLAWLLIIILFVTNQPPSLISQTVSALQNTDFAYAEKLAQDGYTDLAIEQYKLFLQRFPSDTRSAEALRRIADGYFTLEKFPSAREYYERLLLQHGASPFAQDAVFRIGACFEQEGEILDAAHNFERFAILNESLPLSAQAFLKAGALYIEADERIKGRSLLYKVLENYRENEDAQAEANYLLLQDFIAAGEYNRAFNLANAYLRKFSEITATPKVLLLKAKLHEKLGQIPDALETLESIRSKYQKTTAAKIATMQLAELSFKLGDRGKAHTLLSQFNTSSGDSLAKAVAFLQAKLFFEENRFADALTVIQKIPADPVDLFELNFLLGEAYHGLRDYTNALTSFEKAIGLLKDENDSLRCTVLFKAARSAFELGNGAKASGFIRQALQNNPSRILQAELDLLLAQVYYELYEDPARALRIYNDFIENYPENPEVDEVQASLALCYEFLQQWNLAHAEWQRLLQNYPASPYFAQAQNHSELIEKYFSPDYVSLVEKMIGNSGLNGSLNNPKLNQAELHFRFQNYQKAIPLLKDVIGGENEAGTRARAMYLLGSTYYALGDIAYLQKRTDAPAWFDSAKVVLQHVRNKYGEQFDIPELAIKLSLMALRSKNASLATLDSISIAHKDDLKFAPIHAHALTELLPFVVQEDTSAQSSYLKRLYLLSSLLQNNLRNKANLLAARFALLKQDTVTAMLNLEKIIHEEDTRDNDRVEAELLFARLLSKIGRSDEAVQLLQGLRNKYYYSAVADSALYELAALSYRSGKLDETIELLQELRARRAAISDSGPFDLWAEAHLLEARAFEKSGKDLQATGSLLTFLEHYPADARASGALLSLGWIAERVNAISLAKSYYNDVLKLYAARDADVRQAKMRLADLDFRMENYKDARTLALEILQAGAPLPDEMQMTKLAIVANLRQGNLQSAETEIKNFKNKFDDNNEAYAEIQFELGDLYIRQKNFRQADKTFKDVSKKFEGTQFGIQGQFGLGKSLLYQTKTEEALEVLTEIPRKYPDHPFLRAVYLNLGDFYKDQQQWGNAIQALNQVLADSIYDPYHKAALAKLSELYEATGMNDASLSYTREYIRLFPHADETMTFRMRIGSLLLALHQYDEAIRYYRDLLPLAHGDDALAIQYFIGESYFDSGKYELAIAELLKLRYDNKPTKFPWRTTAIYKAGEAYMRLNNLERAKEMLDYVVRMEGANSQMGSFALRKIAQIEEMLKSLPNHRQKS